MAHPKAQDYADLQVALQQRIAIGEMGFNDLCRQLSIGTRLPAENSFGIIALSYRVSITEPEKRRYTVRDRTTLFRVHLREPEAHAHPAVHIFCSVEMLAGELRIARAAMKPTQAQMTMSDDRPHPARLASLRR